LCAWYANLKLLFGIPLLIMMVSSCSMIAYDITPRFSISSHPTRCLPTFVRDAALLQDADQRSCQLKLVDRSLSKDGQLRGGTMP
jgi:hypothetical protein